MHPILLCSIIMLTIVIERTAYFLRIRSANIPHHFALIEHALLKKNFKETQEIIEGLSGPIAHILHVGLKTPEETIEVIEENMAIAGEQMAREAAKGVSLLALIPSVSTLLGLLGTIIGLSLAFKKVAGFEGQVSPVLLASGIWVSLITTVAGLSVAISGLIAHHFIQNRVSRLTFEIEHFGSRLLLLLKKTKPYDQSTKKTAPLNPEYETSDFNLISPERNP